MIVKRYQIALLLAFGALVATGIIGLNVTPVDIERTSHVAITSDGVDISFNLYKKTDIPDNRPVVIMGHGVIVNKEMMTNYAIELAARGFIVASIDWRGHGLSGGPLTNSGLDLDLAAVIAQVAALVPAANMSALGLMGYSMGGGPTFRYAATHPEVKAWIGVGTNAIKNLSTTTVPRNVLIICGQFDEAFSISSINDAMVNLTGAGSAGDVQAGTVYGDIGAGTARKLQVVPGADHLTVPWDRAFIAGAVDWMVQTFDGTVPDLTSMAYDYRLALLVMGMVGLVGIIYGLAIVLAKALKVTPDGEQDQLVTPGSYSGLKATTFTWKFYATTLLMIWSAALPAITMLATPLFMTGFLTTLVACLAIGVLVFSWRRFKERGVPAGKVLALAVRVPRRTWALSAILAATFVACIYPIVGLNYLGMLPSLHRLPWVFLFAAIMFFTVVAYGIFIKHVVMPFVAEKVKARGKAVSPAAVYVLQSLVAGGLLVSWNAIIIGSACLAMGSAFLMMILYLMIPLLFWTTFSGVFFEKTTGSVIPSALLQAVFLTFLIVTVSPVGSLLSMFS